MYSQLKRLQHSGIVMQY